MYVLPGPQSNSIELRNLASLRWYLCMCVCARTRVDVTFSLVYIVYCRLIIHCLPVTPHLVFLPLAGCVYIPGWVTVWGRWLDILHCSWQKILHWNSQWDSTCRWGARCTPPNYRSFPWLLPNSRLILCDSIGEPTNEHTLHFLELQSLQSFVLLLHSFSLFTINNSVGGR